MLVTTWIIATRHMQFQESKQCLLLVFILVNSQQLEAIMELPTLLDDNQVEHRQVAVNNTSTDRLSLSVSLPSWSVTGLSLSQQQTCSAIGEYSLLHGETLLVVSTGDADNISLQN